MRGLGDWITLPSIFSDLLLLPSLASNNPIYPHSIFTAKKAAADQVRAREQRCAGQILYWASVQHAQHSAGDPSRICLHLNTSDNNQLIVVCLDATH